MTETKRDLLAELLAEARDGIARKRPTTTATMMAALDLGEQLFLEGRERDAMLIVAAFQSLQSENIELSSILELVVMGAVHERKILENKMGEVMQAQKVSGHAMVPWATYVDLQEVSNSWARKKAHDDAQRAENARKPRPNRGFPAWMRKTVIDYAATTRTPLPATAVDLIQLEAEKNEYTKNRWPDERTIRRWWKESGASGR